MESKTPTKTVQRTPEELFEFLSEFAKKQHIKATLHKSLAKEEDNFLRLPVYLRSKSAFEEAETLQNLEDAWNNQKPRQFPRLFIVPSGIKNADSNAGPR